MKKLSILFFVFALCTLFALSVSAQDYIVWDFSNKADADKWIPSKSASVTVTDKGAVISGTGDDLNLTFTPTENIRLSDYKYLAIALSDLSASGRLQFYHWTDEEARLPRYETEITAKAGLQMLTCDFSSGSPSTAHWSGNVSSLRLDPCRTDERRQVTVVYVGLFKDKAAYDAYNKANGIDMTETSDSTSASSDYIIWDFSDQANVDKWSASASTNMMVTDSGTVITGSGNEINLSYNPSETISAANYKYVVVALANLSCDGTFQFYHWTSASSGAPRFQTEVKAGAGAQIIAFDLNDTHAYAQWEGNIRTLRLDPLRATEQREFTLVYAGLFRDKATFEAYNAANPVNVSGVVTISPAPVADISSVEPIIWDFSDPDVVAEWVPSASSNFTVTEEGMKYSGSGNDINFTYTPAADEVIRLQAYDILAIGYSDYTAPGTQQFYHWTNLTSGLSVAEHTAPVNEDVDYVYDMKNAPPKRAQWNGTVTSLRLDPCRSTVDRSGTIKYVALFPTAADYNEFMGIETDESAASPSTLYNPGALNAALGIEGTDCTVDYEKNYAVATVRGDDPGVTVNADFNGDAYPWMKIRLRNLSDAQTFEMFFASEGSRGNVNTSTCTQFAISANDADFKEYIINVKEANISAAMSAHKINLTSSMWTGNISKLRFDFMYMPEGTLPVGSQMYVDYAAFFATEEEAKSFTPDPATEIEKAPINSGKANPTWIFDENFDISSLQAGGMDVTTEGGILRLAPSSSDPIVSLPLAEDEYFSTEEFPYFAYRHKTSSSVYTAGIFFTSDVTTVTSDSWSPFTVRNDGVWQNVIADLSDVKVYTNAAWKGICDYVRLDPINGTDYNAAIYIDRMGFFRTVSEAYAFLSQGRSDFDLTKGAEFETKMQKAIVPAGGLVQNFDRSQYLMASETPEGTGTSPVVMRKNSDGTQDIIALSHTNSHGYTTYVADRPGTYVLGYNHKDYTDISGHWGESCINFVSDRTLFGGTSPTEFSPEEAMTRGMFITVLGRMHGVDTSKYSGNTGYSDVPSAEYYAPYIQWAKEYAIMAPVTEAAFEPDAPIFRETMASVIANYITAFGYEFACYSDPVEFNDLADVDAAAAAAIKAASDAGIINGKGGGIFDPKGYSTRAEVAAVMERVIKAVLGVNMASTQYTSDYFQRDRIRIGGWNFGAAFANEQGMNWLRDLGVDTIISGSATNTPTVRDYVFNYADKNGIEVFVNDFPTNKSAADSGYDFRSHAAVYADHPSFSGHWVTDEPGTSSFGWLSTLTKMYKQQLPDKIPFINLLPMYANAAQLTGGAGADTIDYYKGEKDLYKKYCEQWFSDFELDYICTDIYPLRGSSGEENRANWSTYDGYCESINQIASAAREKGADFWCCIQTHAWSAAVRVPTEGEFRWQSYSMLSYGCTGILLWSLQSSKRELPSIFDGYTGTINQEHYDNCATVMWEIRRLSDTYIQYKNLGAFTVNCTSATPWLQMSGEYTDFDAVTDIQSAEPLLIGCFEKKEGTGSAFTVVNMTDLKDNKPAALKFKTSASAVTLYGKHDPAVLTPDADGYYTINLDPADGVFVTIG